VAHGQEPPDQLLANPQNWRVHPQAQQQALGAVLDQVGWVSQILVNRTTGHVIDGHLRVALAISRQEPSVPVEYVELAPEEERLVLATLDPLSALALADADLLSSLVGEVAPFVADQALSRMLVELQKQALVGLDGLDGIAPELPEGEEQAPEPGLSELEAGELDAKHKGLLQTPPDELEALRARWGVEDGQTWTIPSGRTPGSVHRLLVGSCVDQATIQKVGTMNAPSVVVTSPPYGTEQSYEEKGARGGADWEGLVYAFFQRWAPLAQAFAVNLADVVVSETPGREKHTYGTLVGAAQAANSPLVATRIWHKDPTWAGTYPYWLNSYKPVHEFEYLGFFATKGYTFKKVAERVPESEDWRFRGVWQIRSVSSQNEGKGQHPAAFPLELPRRCVLLFTDPGQVVVDPFLGSGTTMVAAEALGRLCVGVERDARFAALALERVSRLGLAPKKEST
jgi:DNA modification methylase